MRESPAVDARSGVSARFAIAAAETVAASALRRAGLRGEQDAVARICDTVSVTSTLRGKVEFDSGEEGRETEILSHLLRVATAETFRARLAGVDLSGFTNLVNEGAIIETGDLVSAEELLAQIGTVPGLAKVLDQVKHYERFLLQPEVGIAIDPEWVLEPGQLPGRQIGALSAAEINEVSAYLSALVRRQRLPEKVFLLHQFKEYMLPDREQVLDRYGLATVFHVDGFGARHSKRQTYDLLSSKDGVIPGGRVHNGYKLFIDEDVPLQEPAEVLRHTPRPELVSYQ